MLTNPGMAIRSGPCSSSYHRFSSSTSFSSISTDTTSTALPVSFAATSPSPSWRRPRPPAATLSTSDGVALEQGPGDHHALDLVGALADDHQRRVSEVALDRQLGGVADPAVDAHGLGG